MPPESPVTAKSSSPQRRRRLLFRLLAVILGWLILELGCYGIAAFLLEDGLGGIRIGLAATPSEATARAGQNETFHPYLGWVKNPEIAPPEVCFGVSLPVNRWGLYDATDGIHQRNPHRLIVAISGGSVAFQMTCAAQQELIEGIQSLPEYQGREVVLVRLCQSGYKQPQGLYTLNYYTLQGAEFDVLINLDGFNELALPTAENFMLNVAMDYPQGWHARTLDIVDPRDADGALRLFELRGLRQRLLHAGQNSWFRGLPSHAVVWYVRDQRIGQQLLALEEELMNRRTARKRAFVHSGPHPLARSEDEALTEAIRLWRQSAEEMAKHCQTHQTRFVQVIQPNQYDVGSKLLSQWELEKCVSPDIGYGRFIEKGYPQLRTHAAEMQSTGMQLVDLTRLFEKESETVYSDPYCHFNQLGSRRMAKAIVAALSEVPPPTK